MDDVVLELGEKWSTLNRNEQRFVATAFAGNLQSNRFLALVSNIDEYKKALEVANDSEGTGTLQFNKTLDNIETRLTKLKTAWQLFYTDSGIEKAIKWVITALTDILTKLNKLPKIGKFISASALAQVASIVNGIRALLNGIVQLIINAIDKLKEKAKRAAQEAGEEARRQAEATGQSIENATNPYDAKIAKGTKIANYMSMAGGAATIAGMAINNPTASSVVSGLGTTASLAGMGVQLGTFAGIPGQIIGGALGGVIGLFKLFSDLSTAAEREAEQKLEELKQAADEAENKRLESKQTVSGLEDYVKQYQEMAKAQYDSNDAKQQFLDLNAEIAEKFPDLLIQYDAEGNKIIRLTELQKELNEAKKQSAEDTISAANSSLSLAKEQYTQEVDKAKDKGAFDENSVIAYDKQFGTNYRKTGVGAPSERYKLSNYLNAARLSNNQEAFFLSSIITQKLKEASVDETTWNSSLEDPEFIGVLYKSFNMLQNNKEFQAELANNMNDVDISNFTEGITALYQATKELKSENKMTAKQYVSAYHYAGLSVGEEGYDEQQNYSQLYMKSKKLGFDMDQYIANSLSLDENYLSFNEDEEAREKAIKLRQSYIEAIFSTKGIDIDFIGKVGDATTEEINAFLQALPKEQQQFLLATWQPYINNLQDGQKEIEGALKRNKIKNLPQDLSSVLSTNNLSMWREIAENDAKNFKKYYNLVLQLVTEGVDLDTVSNIVLGGDFSTISGIQQVEQELKNHNIEISKQTQQILTNARNAVKINPALEFAAMFDTYKKAYEELDKLASSLSTGLELKDAISWATKMGKSINEFTQKEGKFYVSQEQFWDYVNTQLPSIQQLTKDSVDFYNNLELTEGKIADVSGKYTPENLVGTQTLYENWKNKTVEGVQVNKNKDFSAFIQEQKDNIGAEATATYKNLLVSYAIQSIQAFGLITTDIRNKLIEQGLDEAQIKELEDKYLGSATTSTLFSTGKIDIADIGKLPEVLNDIVDTETGKILNYKDALTKLRENIENGKLDAATYAPIYAEAVNSARNDLEAALEGTLDGARASTEYVKDLIEDGVLVINEETGKYQFDLSSAENYRKALKELRDKGYSRRQANQELASSALAQGQSIDYNTSTYFTQEYQYLLSQARKDAVEGLQNAVFDATKSIDISKMYQANKGTLDELAKAGVIRIEENGEKVAIQIVGGTIEQILELITLLGGEDVKPDKSAIISTINSYFDQGLTGELSKSAAEMLMERLGLTENFSTYFKETANGTYQFLNKEIAKEFAQESANLATNGNRTVSQFETDFNKLIKAGFTVDEVIRSMGEVARSVAEIVKNGPQDEYENVVYKTYQGTMNDIYSAMMDGLSNPVGAQIDLTKAKQIGGNAYDTLKEIMTVVETETGEAFGYFKDDTTTEVINMMRSLAIGGNSTVADLLAEYYETIARMITDGMNGDLTATNIEWLQKAFKLTDRMFVKAGTSFRLTEEGAKRIYTTMNGIDAIAGNLSLSVFAKSLQEVDYKLQSVSAVSKEIVRLQEEIIKAHGDKRKALENELALYQEILKVNQQNASSFNIMNNPIMGGAGNAIEAYKGLAQARQAIADMKTTNEYGMNVMDPTNAFRLAEISEQNLMALLKNGKNMVDVYAALGKSMRDIGGNFVIDMSNVASELEISFDNLGTAFGDGSDTALKEIAQVQVDMLDAQINMLEGIVAMEDLTIEKNNAGSIDLDNWITVDKDGNIVDKAKQLGGMLGQVAKEVKGIENEVVTINQNTGENITFGNIIDALNSGKDGFETYLNSLPLDVRERVSAFITNIRTELKKLDFNTVNTGEENLQSFNLVKDMFRNMFGIKEDGTVDLGEGEEITPNIKVTIKTDGTSYYIEGDETPYADLTELGTALAAKLGVEGLTIPEDPFSQTIPMDSKPNVNITCSPEGKWFVNGAETTEENLPTAIRNAMSIDQQNIGTNNDTVYGNDDVLVKMGVNAATSYILGNQEGDEESVKTALKENASLNNQSVGSDDATLTGDINATVNTSIHFDGTNYTADGIDGTFDTKDKVADAIADKYKVDSRTLKEQIGKYDIPVNGSLDISFQTITPSYIVNGEILGTYDEATDAIAAGYEIESKTLPEKTTDLDLPVNSTLDVSFQTVAPSYTVGDKVSSTFDEAADAIGTRAGIEDKKLDPKTITVTQDTIVNFKATLKDAEGNPIQEDNGLDTGIDVKIVPNLGGFSTALWELIQEQEYDVSISPVIANGMELGKAIQQAIDDRQYTVQINPTWPNHGGYTDGSTIQSFNPDGKKKSSSSTKSTNFTGVGSNVKEVDGANNLVLLDDALKTLASSFQTAADNAGTFSKGLEGIVPSSVALRASSAKSALVELGTTTSSTITDLTTIFNKIEELIKKLQEGLPTAAKGNVALAKGSNDALATGTLMGELGPELWVSGGHYYIAGQSGAEFVNLPDDAIVFNHLQTRSLLANGNTTRGRAIGGEDRAVAFAKGSPEGPARASASDTLERLKALRAVWQSLLDLPASDLSKKAGGGGGGGGGAEDYKTFTADLERWYNLLRQIANYEQKITYEQKQRENFKHGQEYVDSLEKELKYLEKQADAYAVLSELQKSYYDQRRKDLNDTQYGKLIFTYTEDGLMQYLDDVVDANGNRQSRGLAILAELNRQSNEKGQSYWDKEGKNLYTGSFKVNGKQTIKGSSGGAAAQLMYLKSVGFDLNELLYNSEGGSNVGKNASETATNMMQTFFDNVDGWMEELDSLYDSYHEYLENIEDNTAAQQKILQEYIDNQMSVEDKLLKAITDRQQKIIDTLKDQIDIIQEAGQEYTQGLSEALSKERNLYNENKDDAELASKMRRLGILKRTGASASEIKALQNEIDNQLQENYFDAQQKQIDAIQEAIDTQLETLNQQLDVMEEALNYQKENGLLWAEVYEMMTKWTPEAMLNFIETYTSSYRENSQQKNSEDSKEALKQLEIWAASRGFDFSREPHKGNSKDYTKPNTSNDVAAPDMPRPSGGATTGGGTSGGSSGSGTSTMTNGLAAPQEIDVENTGVYEDRTLTPTVRQVSKSDVIDIYKVGGYYTKEDGTHARHAWEVNGKLPAGKYYDFNGEIYRNPGAKHRRIIYSATSGKVYYVYDNTYLPNAKKISSYSSGGMNYSTGMAMLHGTSSKPEAILNASDTKLFREKLFGNGDFSLRQAIATIDLLRDQIASTTNNNSSVDFNGVTINISSDVIANDYDAQRAGRNIFDEMIKLSRKSTMLGVSRR